MNQIFTLKRSYLIMWVGAIAFTIVLSSCGKSDDSPPPPAPLPHGDLVMVSIDVPADGTVCHVGDTKAPMKFTLKNLGPEAVAAFEILLTYDEPGRAPSIINITDGLVSGETASYTQNSSGGGSVVTANEVGTRTLKLEIDPNNKINDPDRTNNIKQITINVLPALPAPKALQ